MTNTNTDSLIAAMNLVASFLGESGPDFQNEMIERRHANTLAAFNTETKVIEDTTDAVTKVTLRTENARTVFDARVCRILDRHAGDFVSANNLIANYASRHGQEPTKAQMRAALNRLIEEGDVTYEGFQRGTKYAINK